MRPFPKVARNMMWLLVSTDYFTKWVKVKPLANIKDVDAKRFVWKNIVTRFGIPYTLISDNGLQFNSKVFRRTVVNWVSRIGILFQLTPRRMDKPRLSIKLW